VLVDLEYGFLGELLTLHEAPKILDIGHHIGTFSLWAFCQNPNASILGVEADPETFAIAEKNARLGRGNGLDWRVIQRIVPSNVPSPRIGLATRTHILLAAGDCG
jgi:methylase of polypeptide subunit release factors